MSLILHLSDLHLGSPSFLQRDYDDKIGMEDEAGETNTDHLTHTLEALGKSLTESNRQLDAVVVSGDLTKGNHLDGYEAFAGVLDLLGEARPEDKRIVVLPGNHDVDSERQPGDREKLARFMDATRIPYRTPLVKGLDYKGSQLHLNPGSRGRPEPILELRDAVIVAINSADYCWTRERRTETDWGAVLDEYLSADESPAAAEKRKMASSELAKLRTHDIPKVDKRQIEALEKRLDDAGIDSEADLDPRLRIAAIHHPITPATDEEEIKPFEVITNLAIVRTFLYHRGFHLVLHGHKHSSYAAWDWLQPPRDNLDVVPHRALVLGAPGRFRPGDTVCRLIEICPDGDKPVAGAPRLRIVPVKGVEASEALKLDIDRAPRRSLAQPAFCSQESNTPWVIQAKTADAAYQQLCDLSVADSVSRPVISVVTDAQSVSRLPTNYRERDAVPPLKDLVNWWQQRRPEAVQSYSGSTFNHGERLYGDHDAIVKAVKALPSSKAFALLVRPEEAGDADREFPAFSEVQLQIRKQPKDQFLLDVIGIYRKQDLDLWWPVNMAELGYIQRSAVREANDRKVLGASFSPGRLIAMTMQAVHDDVLPQMAGTALDRAVDLRPEWIYRLAYLAAHPDSVAPDSEAITEWRRALGDIGERPGGGLLVPSVGIRRLRDALRTHPATSSSSQFRKLVRTIEKLADRAKAAEDSLRGQSQPTGSSLDGWGEQLRELARASEKALKTAASAAAQS
ncbi:MAG TPA: metallophosphoesterase [Solirubrobacterales bacterium]|jgi:hypothetical protein|nr:metallophosphoesterase [Solirubrobacterales bacterium]